MGITLDKLMMFTCDANWREEHFADRVKNKQLVVFKKLQLFNLKIYWNSCENNFLFRKGREDDFYMMQLSNMIQK